MNPYQSPRIASDVPRSDRNGWLVYIAVYGFATGMGIYATARMVWEPPTLWQALIIPVMAISTGICLSHTVLGIKGFRK